MHDMFLNMDRQIGIKEKLIEIKIKISKNKHQVLSLTHLNIENEKE